MLVVLAVPVSGIRRAVDIRERCGIEFRPELTVGLEGFTGVSDFVRARRAGRCSVRTESEPTGSRLAET